MSVAVLKTQMPREKWASRISAAWQKQVVDIFEVGTLLEAAKVEIVAQEGHGSWIKLVKKELPFARQTATRLMNIATCDHLRDGTHVHHLPACWGTLYELTKFKPEQFEQGIASGAINSKMKRKDVKRLRGINGPEEATSRISKSSIDPVDRCIMRVRALILEWVPEIPHERHGHLLAELRGEIDSIEQNIKKRASETNGHHTARQPA